MTDLSEYLSFDAEAYLDHKVEEFAALADTLKEQGQWNENTAYLHKIWHAKVIQDRKDYEKYSPELKKRYRNHFLEFIHLVKPLPEVGAEEPLVNKQRLYVGDVLE